MLSTGYDSRKLYAETLNFGESVRDDRKHFHKMDLRHINQVANCCLILEVLCINNINLECARRVDIEDIFVQLMKLVTFTNNQVDAEIASIGTKK